MKQILMLAFLLMASPCFAFPAGFIQAITQCTAGGGGACTTAKDGTLTGTTADLQSLGYDDTRQMIAGNFVAGSSYTVCSVKLVMLKEGSPTFGMKVAIYTDNAGVPGTLVGTASAEILSNTLTTSEATYTFTGLSAAVTSGTTYHVVLYKSSGSFNYYNDYTRVAYYTAAEADVLSQQNGATWTQEMAYNKWKFQTLSN